jgi:hypothetical protein
LVSASLQTTGNIGNSPATELEEVTTTTWMTITTIVRTYFPERFPACWARIGHGWPSGPNGSDTTAYCRVATAVCSAGGGPSGRDGLVRVNSLDGPGYKDVDASLFRDFNIYEPVKAQFRGEATNVFNFVNLSNPGTTSQGSPY